MYTEMLEKDWVRTESKRSEYYGIMRQESERLTRLIENVLDFSRIQRGRKQYAFKAGDFNRIVGDVIEMMTPCAQRAGFTIQRDLEYIESFCFDADAVMQIVINLLDNAIKYARDAEDKTIFVRTKTDGKFVQIEVEDRGPGVPRNRAHENLRGVLPHRRRIPPRDHRHRLRACPGQTLRRGPPRRRRRLCRQSPRSPLPRGPGRQGVTCPAIRPVLSIRGRTVALMR